MEPDVPDDNLTKLQNIFISGILLLFLIIFGSALITAPSRIPYTVRGSVVAADEQVLPTTMPSMDDPPPAPPPPPPAAPVRVQTIQNGACHAQFSVPDNMAIVENVTNFFVITEPPTVNIYTTNISIDARGNPYADFESAKNTVRSYLLNIQEQTKGNGTLFTGTLPPGPGGDSPAVAYIFNCGGLGVEFERTNGDLTVADLNNIIDSIKLL